MKTLRKKRQDHPSSPILVHCSAGIGRTGTLITLYYLITELTNQRSNGNPVEASIFGTVRSLREQRAGAVQTYEQYEYIYDFVSRFLQGDFN